MSGVLKFSALFSRNPFDPAAILFGLVETGYACAAGAEEEEEEEEGDGEGPVFYITLTIEEVLHCLA